LIEQIQARIWHDSEFRHELLKSSERWSARAEDVGSLQESLDKLQGDDASAALADFDVENEMHDVEDGLLFRRHPRLGREGAIYAPSDEHGTEHHQVVKLCFIAYLDGIETANPLGVARGSHSMECVYVALLNLPLTMRYRMENLFPVTLCNTSTLKRFGTRAVIGGRGGGDVELEHPRSLGAVMRKLDAGISLKFPSAEAERGYEYRWCCGWQLLFLADFPAAGKVLPTAESVSATMPCRGCTWRRSWTQRSQPCGSEQDDAFEDGASFLPCFGGKQCWELRTMDHFQRACSQARECRSQRLKDDALKEAGYQQNEFCLHPDDFPLFEPFTGGVPQDAMHTLYCKLPLLAPPPQPPPFNRV
jgi:hypothetical protein